MQATAVLAALGAAAGFAVSTSLQHQAAENAPASVDRAARLLGHLARRPLWLLGQLVAAVSFALHAVALHAGALALVQPIVVSGIVLAIPARAALSRRAPSPGELAAVSLTAAGLALFLVSSDPTVGDSAGNQLPAAVLTVLGVALAAGCAFVAAHTQDGGHRAFFLGVTAGVLFGLVAGLVKLSIRAADVGGLVAVLTAWSTWSLVVLGACGVATNQRAYQAATLSASMPALNIVNVLVALAFGLIVFSEVPAHTPIALAVELVALGCIAGGLRTLAVSAQADHRVGPDSPKPSARSTPS